MKVSAFPTTNTAVFGINKIDKIPGKAVAITDFEIFLSATHPP